MVVLEVRILDKLGATYGPSFESMRRSGPPNQPPVLASSRKMAPRSWRYSDSRAAAHVPQDRTSGVVRFETRTRGKGRVCSAARQPCHGRAFNDVPRYLVGARGHLADRMPRQRREQRTGAASARVGLRVL